MDLTALITAIIGAIIYSFSGYLNRPEGEPFKEEKAITTLLIGIAVGVVSYFVGTNYDAALQVITNAGFVVVIEKYGKAIWKKISKWLQVE